MSSDDQPSDSIENDPLETVDGFAATQDDKLWAMLSHLSGFLGYSIVVGQFAAPLIIYLMYKDKSRYVAYHALQSLYFQLALLLVLIFGWGLAAATCGALLPIAFAATAVVGVATLVCPIIAAINAYNGKPIEYWIVGKFAREHVGT